MFARRLIRVASRWINTPKLSKYNSVSQIINDQSYLLNVIGEHNYIKENSSKSYSYLNDLYLHLNFPENIARHILKQQIQFNAYSAITQKQHPIKTSIVKQTNKCDIIPQQLQYSYNPAQHIPLHYSINRYIPNIPQYSIQSNQIYLFNLPDQITEHQIQTKLKQQGYKVKSIKIGYCVMNLPAYAKVQLNSKPDKKIEWITFNSKNSLIKNNLDSQKLSLKNRFLVIKGIDKNMLVSEIFYELMKYGKITYFDMPSTVIRSSTLKEVKQTYKKSPIPVKINIYKRNGQIQSQYYPPFQQKKIDLSKGSFQLNYYQSIEASKNMYKKRLRFCQNIDIYEDPNVKTIMENKGFALVAFSCTEEAQNCYFCLKQMFRMDLVKDKQQFEMDQDYRLKLLRLIDNQYIDQQNKQLIQAKQSTKFQKLAMSLYDRLSFQFIDQKINNINSVSSPDNQLQKTVFLYKDYIDRLNKIKNTVGKNDGYGKSFGQLAEIELYGRQLPKESQKRLFNLDNLNQQQQPNVQDFSQPKRRGFPSLKSIQKKQLKMERINKKIKGGELSLEQVIQTQENAQETLKQPQNDIVQQQSETGQNIGKNSFSTYTSQKFRKPTLSQKCQRIIKYNSMIRNIINEYLGIFSQQKFLSNFKNKDSSVLNPHKIKFSNGQQFITQEQLPKILQFHRKKNDAQMLYQNFIKYKQIFSALDINVQENIVGNIDANYYEGLLKLRDSGVVEQAYKWNKNQENIDQFINKLNALQASFGYQYRKVVTDNTQYITKIKKLQYIAPLDRIGNIQRFMNKMQKQFQKGNYKFELQIIKRNYQEIMEKQTIPLQVKMLLNLKQDEFDFDKILAQVGVEQGIWKKDLQMLEQLQQKSQQQVQRDIKEQLQIEKVRTLKRGVRQSDFYKDPSNNNVKDSQKTFKVSKFRQM